MCASHRSLDGSREVFKADPIRHFYGFCQRSFSVRIFLFSSCSGDYCFFTSHQWRLIAFEIESNGCSFPFTRIKYHQRKHPVHNADCVVTAQFLVFVVCQTVVFVLLSSRRARLAEMAELCNQLVRRATRVAFCAPGNEVAA
jgi:hypothetical protein